MKKTFFLAALLSLGYSYSYAEPVKFVTLPNKQLVPCDHPLAISAGLSCSALVEDPPYDCSGTINPYAEPDRAAYCAARSIQPTSNKNEYKIGERYAHAYAYNRMVVIGIVRDMYNRTVVIYQWYQGWQLNEIGSFIVGVTEQPFTKVD